jgi:hypothetical protein
MRSFLIFFSSPGTGARANVLDRPWPPIDLVKPTCDDSYTEGCGKRLFGRIEVYLKYFQRLPLCCFAGYP